MGIWEIAGAVPMVLLATLVGAAIYNSLQGWRTHKLVPKEFYVEFEPAPAERFAERFDLSGIVCDLMGDNPVFVVIKGRPAGLINFLREYINIPRRFEFAMCDKQAVIRRASITGHFIQSSKLTGVHSITINQTKVNPLLVFFYWWLTNLVIAFIFAVLIQILGFYSFADERFFFLLALLVTVFYVIFYFKSRIVWVSLLEGTEVVTRFGLCPAILERMFGSDQRDMALDDANNVAKIFTALKDTHGR
jgi:hypothetical protein